MMKNILKILISLTLVLFLHGCDKEEEVAAMVPENCDLLSSYSKFNFEEEFGSSFTYVNSSTQRTKVFNYSEESSLFDSITQRLFCTEFSYANSGVLIYEDANSDDEIRLHIYGNLSEEYIPYYFLTDISGMFNGQTFDTLRSISDFSYLYLDEHNRLIYHDKVQDFLFAFDDREGNRWLKSESSHAIENIYCEIVDNFGAYKQTPESMRMNRLYEQAPFEYGDGFINTYTFNPKVRLDQPRLKGTDVEEICIGGTLAIEEIGGELYVYEHSIAYSLFMGIETSYESVSSNNYYSYIRLNLDYLLGQKAIYRINLVIGDQDLYEMSKYNPPPSEYVFHESIELKGNNFLAVYEFNYEGQQLFFNLENGVLAFQDHVGIMNYLNK